VVCLILAVMTGWYTVLVLPEAERTTYYHESRIRQLTGYLKDSLARQTGYPERDEYINGLREDIRKENEDYPKALAALPGERREVMLTAVSVWLGLCVGLYVIGWLIGWIYRGFRPKVSS
jgi:hypothetical protein